MTPEQFVEGLRIVALDATVRGTVELLEAPPGRKPSTELVELSVWYRSLSESDRAMLTRVLKLNAHGAVFGVLAVLDNVSTVEDDSEKGDFSLVFRKHGEEFLITDPNGEMLHDILNTEMPCGPAAESDRW